MMLAEDVTRPACLPADLSSFTFYPAVIECSFPDGWKAPVEAFCLPHQYWLAIEDNFLRVTAHRTLPEVEKILA
jgi:hypothetical protein